MHAKTIFKLLVKIFNKFPGKHQRWNPFGCTSMPKAWNVIDTKLLHWCVPENFVWKFPLGFIKFLMHHKNKVVPDWVWLKNVTKHSKIVRKKNEQKGKALTFAEYQLSNIFLWLLWVQIDQWKSYLKIKSISCKGTKAR